MAMKTRYTVVDGEVIAEKRNGTRKQYVPDPLGSTVALLDNTQAQTDTFAYWPYGEEASRTGTTPTPFRFVGTAGYYRDSGTKTYVRARYLDVQKGRWLTQDPLTSESYSNLYSYGNENPIWFYDASGLSAAIIWVGSWMPEHFYISIEHCPGLKPNRNGRLSTGLYGIGGAGLPNPGITHSPDPHALHLDPNQYIVQTNDDPAFERALCQCILHANDHPGYFWPFKQCFTYVNDLWQCAEVNSRQATHQNDLGSPKRKKKQYYRFL